MSAGILSSVFARLLLVTVSFTFSVLAVVVHFVPLLTSIGVERVAAAATASLLGLSSLAGRLGTGVLLDRFHAARVGAVLVLLPACGCALLLGTPPTTWSRVVAAVLIGLSVGAEVDLVAYLVTRHFGMRNFGGLFGIIFSGMTLSVSSGPLVAAMIFDRYGSYAPLLWLTMALTLVCSLTLLSLPRPPVYADRHGAGPASA